MKRVLFVVALLGVSALAGCDKYGAGSGIDRLLGNWVPVTLPDGCVVKQIAAEENGGVAVLCEDGRVFH